MSVNRDEQLMICAHISNTLNLPFLLMIRGRRFAHGLSGLLNSKHLPQRRLAGARSKKFSADCAIVRRKRETVRRGEIDLQTVVRTEKGNGTGIEGIDLTVVTAPGRPGIAEAPSQMRTKRTVAKLSPNGKRTIVSPAWPKVCCLTVVARIQFAIVIVTESVNEIVVGTETAIETETGSVIENETETETENGIVTASVSVIETGTEIGIATIIHARGVMNLQATTTESAETVKRSARDSIAAAWRRLQLKSFPMATSVRLLLDDAGPKMTMIMIAVTRGIQR